jgi:CysZ protein
MRALASGFTLGFLSFFQGFLILAKNSKLWKYAIVPLIAAFSVFVFLLVKLAPQVFSKGMVEAEVLLPSWMFFADAILIRLLLWIILFFAAATLSFIAMRVLAGPINGILAEHTLSILSALKHKPMSKREWLLNFGKMLVVGLFTASVFTLASIVLFPLSFIPGLNLLAAFMLMLIATFEVSDYSFEAQRMGFRARFRYFFENLRYFFGFATAMSLVFFIPGFSLILFPVAVVGAAQLMAHVDRRI